MLNNPEQMDKLYSFEHIRKYHDAMLFGASQSRAILTNNYYVEVRKFLDDRKKEVASAKKEGKTDESAAEAFSFPLYTQLCTWFLQNGSIFEWCFMIMQWNCMARSTSIDDIGFRNLHKHTDSIVAKYDQTKKDKAGDKCTDKNLCANPENPCTCLFFGSWNMCSN